MPECVICERYTKINGGLCIECYNYEKKMNFSERMIKGRIAETLIEQLFVHAGYDVYKYGMESTIPGIMNVLNTINSPEAQKIRRMPDFVVLSKDKQRLHFIEVKFRASGRFNYASLDVNFPDGYDSAFVIVVSKRHIKCLTVRELKERKEITPECRNWLGNRPEFKLDKNLIVEYCGIAEKFFDPI